MILVNPKLELKIEKVISDNNGRYINLDATVDDSHVILINIYAPNDLNQHLAFFNDLQHTRQEFAQEYIIMGGDFNCAPHDKEKKGGNPVSKKNSRYQENRRNYEPLQFIRYLAQFKSRDNTLYLEKQII